MQIKVGFGFDSHRLEKGKELILGGVSIPADVRAVGFSDADVVIHSLCDALLGAMAEKDIGEHFPDTDEKNKGRKSVQFLEKIKEILGGNNYKIGNIDITVILEKPKLTSYKEEIKENLSRILKTSVSQVSFKAKSPEGAYSENIIICFSTVLLFLEGR